MVFCQHAFDASKEKSRPTDSMAMPSCCSCFFALILSNAACDTFSFCRARKRIKINFFHQVHQHLKKQLNQQIHERLEWRKFRLLAIDTSSVHLRNKLPIRPHRQDPRAVKRRSKACPYSPITAASSSLSLTKNTTLKMLNFVPFRIY